MQFRIGVINAAGFDYTARQSGSRQQSFTLTTNHNIRDKLAERWSQRSPKVIANRFSAPLYGTAGEWDLPAGVEPKRDLLYLAVGIPDADSLPREQLARASQRVYDKPGDLALRYGFGLGPTGVRQWLAEHRNQEAGVNVDEQWFQMTNGSSGAIDLIVRSTIDPGDVIIAENPTYMGTLHNFRGVGAEVRFVPMDEQGLQTERLAELLKQLRQENRNVKFIYTISAFQNPTGTTLSLARRQQLLELAFEHDVMILDDEAYRELWFDQPPPPTLSALSDGHGVITTGTFSKTIATGIRIGYIHARPDLLELFGRMRFAMGGNQPGLRAMGEFLTAGEYEPHLDKVRQIYRDKRDRLHAAMTREVSDYMTWQVPDGGFYLWATVREDLSMEAIWRTAVAEGIAVNSGKGFSPSESGSSRCIRIAFPWTPIEQFDEAARRLRLACERVTNGDAA